MSQTSSNPATLRLPFKEKLAYGLGDLGSNILLDIGASIYSNFIPMCWVYQGLTAGSFS